MSTNRTDWVRIGREFLSGQVVRETPLWLPTAMFICKVNAYEGRDSNLSTWRSRLREKVETESPLGEEQTRWGFARNLAKREYLLFMTSVKSMQQAVNGHAEESGRRFWYPGVLALCTSVAKRAEWRFLLESQCVTAAYFPEGAVMPVQIISRFLPKGEGENLWLPVYNRMRAELSAREEGELGALYKITGSTILQDASRLELEYEEWEENNAVWELRPAMSCKAEWLTTGNLRPLTNAEQRQIAEARFNRVSWWGLLALLLALVVLGGLHLEILWKQGRNHRLSQEIKERAPIVREIEAASSELAFLRSLERDRGNPFDWMLVVNANRPETVIFESFAMRDGRNIEIRGVAPQPGLVTTFRDRLDATREFSKLNLTTGRSDQAGTQFSINLETARYKPVWKPESEENSEGAASEQGSGDTATTETNSSSPAENVGKEETSSQQPRSQEGSVTE